MPGGAGTYRFGPFVIERPAFRVLRGGEPLALSPKLVDLLLYFVARPAILVTKEELLRAIWPDVAVTDNALSQAVSDLRQALGDEPSAPQYIQTVARRGYRFIAAVESADETGEERGSGVGTTSVSEQGMLRPVAVLDFVNLSRDSDLDWLATGIAETVTNDLGAFRVLRIIDRGRVSDAARRTDGTPTAMARELGVPLVVVGSFQRAADRLRITARIVEVQTGTALADAKVDGRLQDVFDLQDRIVRQFSASLGVEAVHEASTQVGVRETANLDAFRAASEARVKLDSFDPRQVSAAIDLFERAVQLDPRYAMAFAGLAHAHFLLYETTRARNQPDAARLATAISQARRAVDLHDTLAEGHATLAFLLVSAGRLVEAAAAGRRAVALDPADWRHLFRLGHATWGSERLDALRRALAIYPEIAFAHFEIAMVHLARNQLELAAGVLHQGVELQDRQAGRAWRYPASGLHWLLGMIRLAQGQVGGAIAEFDREIDTSSASHLYGPEMAMNAHDGTGFAHLATRNFEEAEEAFGRALAVFPDHARSHIGRAAALVGRGRQAGADEALQRADASIADLVRTGRLSEAGLLSAFAHVVRARPSDALVTLDRLLTDAPPGFPGWTIPIEPLLEPLRGQPAFTQLLERLADRAR